MLRLSFDVMTNRSALRGADGKRAVTFLPRKLAHANLTVHPTRRNRLQFAKHISQTMRCAKADQQVDVIRDTAHALGNSIRRADDSTKVRVQVIAPCWLNQRLMIFRSENDVIMRLRCVDDIWFLIGDCRLDTRLKLDAQAHHGRLRLCLKSSGLRFPHYGSPR